MRVYSAHNLILLFAYFLRTNQVMWWRDQWIIYAHFRSTIKQVKNAIVDMKFVNEGW
jgi:hypothetical protein